MKIGIIGIGAVGGYLSAMMCKNPENEVYIISQGETLNAIKESGIQLKSEVHGNFTTHPYMIVDNGEKAGIMDVVFVCVKPHSLKAAASKIKSMVDEYTLVVPIVNGVEIADKLYNYLNKGQIFETASYIRAWVEKPGIYCHKHKTTKFIISMCKNHPIYDINLEIINEVMTRSGILCEIGRDAEAECWNRYVFNCAFNITDSYYDVGVKGILEDRMKFETFCNVARECEMVGRQKGVNIRENIIDVAIRNLKKLSPKSMSDMHKNMIFGKKFELEIYCGELCRMGEAVGVSTPYSKMAYEKLKMIQIA